MLETFCQPTTISPAFKPWPSPASGTQPAQTIGAVRNAPPGTRLVVCNG